MIDYTRFRKIIAERRQQLTRAGESAVDGTSVVELDQTRVGRLSRMDALQMQQMNLAAERRRKSELVALGAALERIDHKEYGMCFECGEEINQKRLEVDPVATLCVACAEKKEAG